MAADWPLYGVLGNNDGEKAGLLKICPDLADGPVVVEVEGVKVGVVHDRDAWVEQPCDLLLFGHSHQCFYKKMEGRLEINPGELGGWLHGKSTAAIYDSETADVEIIEV